MFQADDAEPTAGKLLNRELTNMEVDGDFFPVQKFAFILSFHSRRPRVSWRAAVSNFYCAYDPFDRAVGVRYRCRV